MLVGIQFSLFDHLSLLLQPIFKSSLHLFYIQLRNTDIPFQSDLMGGKSSSSRNHPHQMFCPFVPAFCLSSPTKKRGAPDRTRSFFDDPDDETYSSTNQLANHERFLYVCNEPSSPRIGCLGQITSKATISPPLTIARRLPKLSKITRILSGTLSMGKIQSNYSSADMDPPLPVVRHTKKDATISLWKRRRAGQDLEDLQIKPLQFPIIRLAPLSRKHSLTWI